MLAADKVAKHPSRTLGSCNDAPGSQRHHSYMIHLQNHDGKKLLINGLAVHKVSGCSYTHVCPCAIPWYDVMWMFSNISTRWLLLKQYVNHWSNSVRSYVEGREADCLLVLMVQRLSLVMLWRTSCSSAQVCYCDTNTSTNDHWVDRFWPSSSGLLFDILFIP